MQNNKIETDYKEKGEEAKVKKSSTNPNELQLSCYTNTLFWENIRNSHIQTNFNAKLGLTYKIQEPLPDLTSEEIWDVMDSYFNFEGYKKT